MKKYIYSPHHQGAVEAPLMTEPNQRDYWLTDPAFTVFNHGEFDEAMAAYNTWLSSPPIAKVPDEHKEWFSVDRDESEFERQHQILLNGEWVNCSFFVWEKDLNDKRIVAIPKEESKLTNLDHWFVATLKSLIGAEEYMVKRGIKKEIDRNILSAWVKRHSSNINEEQEDSPIEAVRDILNYIYAGGDSPYWMLKEVQMRLEKLITQ
jgi:hypothetical protein